MARPTEAQIVALRAVSEGRVRVSPQGQWRIVGDGRRPAPVALLACQRAGWVDVNVVQEIAYLTDAGWEALREVEQVAAA